jgi:ribosome biogenesis GTPase
MELDQLGWTPSLDFYFTELNQPSWVAARVVRVERGRATLLGPAGEHQAVWPATIPVPDERPVALPAIGDWCAASNQHDLHRIEVILPRSSVLARAMTRGSRVAQVLAANVDLAFLVTGLDRDFSLRRIERYLALARAGGVEPVIVLNKADLEPDLPAKVASVEKIAPAVQVIALCALQGGDVERIRDLLRAGKTGVFLGSSGAGKSTLLNGLLGADLQHTAPVRRSDDRGCHTTTRRELFMLPDGGSVIDTPGLREVGLLVDARSLDETFQDVAVLAERCRFQDCGHQDEPGCAVHEAVMAGELAADRLASYLKLQRETEQSRLRQDTHARREQERKTFGRYRKDLATINRFKGKN